MRLKISHTTEYVYDEPAKFSLQRLRLTPPTSIGQAVLNWRLDVDGAKPEANYEDQYGNHVTLVSVEGEQNTTRITAEGEIYTEDRNGMMGPHVGFCPLWLFLRETSLTKSGKLIRDLVKSVPPGEELARMHELMALIRENVDYQPGASTTATTAEEALEKKSGVCQDHAHIFIAAARTIGIPARYVSGYLLLEETTQQTATHAWAEAHITGLGWVGFDPANKICPDDRYVRLASGLSYKDAAPVSGMRIGTPGETLSVSVSVEGSEQSQSSQGQSQSQS
ncbi:transglutaminase family protein [Oryzifoliimicrobium ureilyticus]|uniref:transglutaminase family protein n=1 Tax=Oryzifoliimicrobium ureilyticus TaxID=3113724 RepID=UPI0030766B47